MSPRTNGRRGESARTPARNHAAAPDTPPARSTRIRARSVARTEKKKTQEYINASPVKQARLLEKAVAEVDIKYWQTHNHADALALRARGRATGPASSSAVPLRGAARRRALRAARAAVGPATAPTRLSDETKRHNHNRSSRISSNLRILKNSSAYNLASDARKAEMEAANRLKHTKEYNKLHNLVEDKDEDEGEDEENEGDDGEEEESEDDEGEDDGAEEGEDNEENDEDEDMED